MNDTVLAVTSNKASSSSSHDSQQIEEIANESSLKKAAESEEAKEPRSYTKKASQRTMTDDQTRDEDADNQSATNKSETNSHKENLRDEKDQVEKRLHFLQAFEEFARLHLRYINAQKQYLNSQELQQIRIQRVSLTTQLGIPPEYDHLETLASLFNLGLSLEVPFEQMHYMMEN